MTSLAIRNGRELFETTETRRLRRISWVPIPNKHDGKGYRRLIRKPNGPALYGAWVAILAVASKCPVRWVLADEDGPLTAADIADKTGIPAATISAALNVLCDKEIGWLQQIDRESAGTPTDAPGAPADTTGRREGKGREGKGTEGKLSEGVSDDFDRLWELYPRREGKKAALRHFQASVQSPKDRDELEAAIRNYVEHVRREGIEPRFVKTGATFFNNWRDWFVIPFGEKPKPAPVDRSVGVDQGPLQSAFGRFPAGAVTVGEFSTWFRPIRLVDRQAGEKGPVWTLQVPNQVHVDWLSAKYRDVLESATGARIEFVKKEA